MKSESNLIYFLSETHYFARDYSVLNVTLVGPLIVTNAASFKDCCSQIVDSNSKCIIINFRDVPSQIDTQFLSLLGDLLKGIRSKAAHCRLSGVHPDIRKVLQEMNLVQTEEFVNNLADAFNSLPLTAK